MPALYFQTRLYVDPKERPRFTGSGHAKARRDEGAEMDVEHDLFVFIRFHRSDGRRKDIGAMVEAMLARPTRSSGVTTVR